MTDLSPLTNGSKKYLKALPKIDMTPMVDLGFLLITFFIFTASISESKALRIVMPADGPSQNTPASKTITAILQGSDTIQFYHGLLHTDKGLQQTSYHTIKGFGAVIRHKQAALGTQKNDLMILIKPTGTATYNNLINLLDEVAINEVKKYAIVDVSAAEQAFIK